MDKFTGNRFKDILIDTLESARRQDYSGYSKFDALNSPFLNALTFNNKWLRLIYTQAVKQSPFDIRPLLRVHPAAIDFDLSSPAFAGGSAAMIWWLG